MAAAKKTNKYREKFLAYWKSHPNYTAGVHVILGLGIGMLYATYNTTGSIDSFAWALVFVGTLGHFYAMGA